MKSLIKTSLLGIAVAALFALTGCASHDHSGHAHGGKCCIHGKCCASATCCDGSEKCCAKAESCCVKKDAACCKKS